MVSNFPGPFELRLTYTALSATEPLRHTQRLSLDLTSSPPPGSAFGTIDVKTRGAVSTPTLSSVVEAWWALVDNRYETKTTIGVVELWKYTPLTFESQFLSSYNPILTAGTSVDATVKAAQEIFTFRTIEGGIMRVNLMEGVEPLAVTQPYPTGDSDIDDIFDFVTSSDNWILARDTSYPFASLNFLPGQNEKSFRQRFR